MVKKEDVTRRKFMTSSVLGGALAAAAIPMALSPESAEAAATKPSDGRPVVPVTAMHEAIAAFQGKWKISQKMYPAPGSKPLLAHGRTTCRVVLGGLAVFMETELDNGYKAIVLTTWNPNAGRYEGVFLDIHSFDGFDPLDGLPAGNFQEVTNPPAPTGSPVPRRVWNGRLTIPHFTKVADGAALQLAGVDKVSVEIVENQLSDSEWVAECITSDAAALEPFVMVENTYTSA